MFDVADFRCSNPNYENYLKDEAFKEQKASIAQARVFVLKKKNVVGYVSLAMGNVTKTKHTKLSTLPHTDVPGILLGRLATHVTYERMGVGTYMISWVFSEAKRQQVDVGCRIVYLNPEEQSANWYAKMGFRRIEHERKQDIMFYDMHRWYYPGPMKTP